MGKMNAVNLAQPILLDEYSRSICPSMKLDCDVFEDDLVRERLGDGQGRAAHYDCQRKNSALACR